MTGTASDNETIIAFPRKQRRTRSYLTEAEVERLMWAARKHGRQGHRDATMILIAYRHGLCAGDLVGLQWSQIQLDSATLLVQRLKHPLSVGELRALRRLRWEQSAATQSVFVSERGAPMTPRGFARVLSRAAARVAFPIAVHPHMLRRASGERPANAGRSHA